MLRGAIENRPGYFTAMTALGVTLQAKNQVGRRAFNSAVIMIGAVTTKYAHR